MSCYHYTATVGSPKPGPVFVCCNWRDDQYRKSQKSLQNGLAIGQGANVTKELVNLPGNVCTIPFCQGLQRCQEDALSVSVLDEKMASMGMGSLLSVGNGSDEPSKLIVIKYQGGKANDAPYCWSVKALLSIQVASR